MANSHGHSVATDVSTDFPLSHVNPRSLSAR